MGYEDDYEELAEAVQGGKVFDVHCDLVALATKHRAENGRLKAENKKLRTLANNALVLAQDKAARKET